MKRLADNFNKAYPNVSVSEFHDEVSITEPENDDSSFRKLNIRGIDGYAFPHDIANNLSSFATQAGHQGVLTKNCDGVIIFEYNKQKYVALLELKSSFDTQKINDARDQIIGSYIKMRGLLSTLQNFQDYVFIGIIVSFEPDSEKLDELGKRKEDPSIAFAIYLNHHKKKLMPAKRCNSFYHPLNVGDFLIHYVPVKERKPEFTIDINELLGVKRTAEAEVISA